MKWTAALAVVGVLGVSCAGDPSPTAAEQTFIEDVRSSSPRSSGYTDEYILDMGYELCASAERDGLGELFDAFEDHPDEEASGELFMITAFALGSLCPEHEGT